LCRSSSEEMRKLERKGCQMILADVMDADALDKVMEKHKFDVVVSTLGGTAIYQGQMNLIKACEKHKVSHFFPSEYGIDLSTSSKKVPLFNS